MNKSSVSKSQSSSKQRPSKGASTNVNSRKCKTPSKSFKWPTENSSCKKSERKHVKPFPKKLSNDLRDSNNSSNSLLDIGEVLIPTKECSGYQSAHDRFKSRSNFDSVAKELQQNKLDRLSKQQKRYDSLRKQRSHEYVDQVGKCLQFNSSASSQSLDSGKKVTSCSSESYNPITSDYYDNASGRSLRQKDEKQWKHTQQRAINMNRYGGSRSQYNILTNEPI